MKHTFSFLVLLVMSFVYSSCSSVDYSAETNLSTKADRDSFKYSIIRYVGKLPKRATDTTKFDHTFDEDYKELARISYLDKYYKNPKDGYIYFETRRLAPSMQTPLYVSTGGRLKYNDKDSITEYEEIYRTWKLPVDKLEEKTAVFFHKMVQGEDLSPYYTDNIGDMEHIEFPDKHNSYNKQKRKWEFK